MEMSKFKHIAAIFIVLGLLSTLAYLLPYTSLNSFVESQKKEQVEIPDSTDIQDTTPFIDKLKSRMGVIQSQYSKKQKKNIWTIGKGRTVTYNFFIAKKIVEQNGGKILYMEDTFNNNAKKQDALLDLETPEGDTLSIALKFSESCFNDSSSYISIAFQVKKIDDEMIKTLNSLDFPFDLLVTPFSVADDFFSNLDKITNKEIILWLLMESDKINANHSKMRAIRSHHTEEQINTIISEAKALIPSASGIATRFAESAVKHKNLLQAILSSTKKNNLWFADLTMEKKSMTAKTCADIGLSCRELQPFNPDNSSEADYITKQLRTAKRSGLATIILPLDKRSLESIKDLKSKTSAQGTSIINLSKLIKYK